jgi:DNA replication initiation complex subunit (GINS family)
MGMITYETLRRIEHEEREQNKLSKLPENFLRKVSEYLEKKEAIAGEGGAQTEYKAKWQTFRNIIQMRERKIVNFTLSCARSGAIPDDMTPEERELFDSIVRDLLDFEGKRQKLMSGERVEMETVAFLQDVSEFVGIDMANYGPYKSGDIATVPKENAKVLAEKGAGEIVEV